MLDASVVAGRDKIGVENQASCKERIELDELIAADAWVRRSPILILLDEVLDDSLAKQVTQIQCEVSNAEHVRHAACILNGTQSTARILTILLVDPFELRPDIEGDAHNVITLLHEQASGDGAVHAATHANEDSTLTHTGSWLPLAPWGRGRLPVPSLRFSRLVPTESLDGQTPAVPGRSARQALRIELVDHFHGLFRHNAVDDSERTHRRAANVHERHDDVVSIW